MWVIWRLDQGGGWVSKPGSRHSYTHRLQEARVWRKYFDAVADACENEQVQEVKWIMQGGHYRRNGGDL